jgi:hypothetical protein
MGWGKLILGFWAWGIVAGAVPTSSPLGPSARYVNTIQNCFKKSFQDLKCQRVVNGNPLRKDKSLGQLRYVFEYGAVDAGLGRWERNKSLIQGFWDAENASFWGEVENENSYQLLKASAVRKAQKENLQDCQKACLATCISSSLLKYNDESRPHHLIDGLGRLEGNCREFSAMALDVMRALDVESDPVVGKNYKINEDQKPVESEQHAMVQVFLDGVEFIMEPQRNACEFFDPEFTLNVRKIHSEALNLAL